MSKAFCAAKMSERDLDHQNSTDLPRPIIEWLGVKLGDTRKPEATLFLGYLRIENDNQKIKKKKTERTKNQFSVP